jgi:uncharacterized protein
MHKRLLLLFTSWIPLMAAAMDCPDPPQQVSKDTKASVEVAVGRLGVLKAADAAIAVNRVTVDLLKSVPRADQIYLEQMLFAAYCSSVRDDRSTSDAEKSKSIRAYAIEGCCRR